MAARTRRIGLARRLPKGSSARMRAEVRITKEGDASMGQLLVECPRHIPGPFGRDCQLRRRGLELARRGGRGAKRKARTALAQKRAVRLHQLEASGEHREPWEQGRPGKAA